MLAAREAFESHGELPEEGDLDFVKGNRGYDEPSGGYNYQSRVEMWNRYPQISSILSNYFERLKNEKERNFVRLR